MKIYATFDQDGFPTGFWNDDVYPSIVTTGDDGAETEALNPTIPAEAIPITERRWRAFVDNPGRRRVSGDRIVTFEPPAAPPPPSRYSKKQLFEAMTDAEYAMFEAAEAQQGNRDRRVFREATELNDSDPGFPRIMGLMTAVYGDERSAVLMQAARL